MSGPLTAVRIAVDGTELGVSVEGDVARARADLVDGSHVADARAVDATGHEIRRLWRFETSSVDVRRLAGSDRIGTAIAVSQDRFAVETATAAVLARADGFADALTGVPLAAANGAPLLLTGSQELDPAVAAELQRVLVDGAPVLLLGGEGALGANVANAVTALGFRPQRVGGSTRYETAALVAAQLPTAESATAVLASGETFPDALAASVPAAVAGWPVLLTARDALPPATTTQLRAGGYERVVVVGGEQAVDRAVEPEITAAVERVAGATRYDTAAAITRRFADLLDPAGGVALSSGSDFPDALAGGAHAAAQRAPLVLVGATLPPPSAALLTEYRPAQLTAYGGPAALAEDVLAAARAAVSDRGRPVVTEPSAGAQLDDIGPGTSFRIDTDLPEADAARSNATLTVDGRELDTVLRAEGRALHLEVVGIPDGLRGAEPHTVRLIAAVRGPALLPVRHVQATFGLVRPPATRTPEGFDLVGGDGVVVGPAGPIHTYSLEVEPASGIDPYAFAAEAETILSDARGWTARGERRLQRIGRTDAQVRVVLATPATVDAYCARAGLRTQGRYSCWNGRFAMLNADRWRTGAAPFTAPLEQYRAYLVSHEVGHGLGYGHVGCPASGALAPVMMQQTISIGACLPNAWPYP